MKGFAYWGNYVNLCQTMQEDCPAGLLRYGNANACGYSLAKASRDAKATMEDFLLCARQYLATVGDRNSCVYSLDPAYEEWDFGFKTRRVGDHLYVTEATEESGVKPGDEIYAGGDERIPDLRIKYGENIFWENKDEREDWDLLLRMYDTMEVFPGDGSARRVSLKKRKTPEHRPENTLKEAAPGVLLLTLESLADPEEIKELMEENRDRLAAAKTLILDLRNCEADGDPESFLPLLPYLVDSSCQAGTLFPTRTIYTSYTRQNAQRRITQLEMMKEELAGKDRGEEEERAGEQVENTEAENTEAATAEDKETVLAYLNSCIDEVREKAEKVRALRGTKIHLHERKQFNEIEESEESGIEEEWIEKAEGPEKVLILADTTTRYAGEWLMDGVRGQKKGKTIGRPTAGMLDYTNFITVDYDDILARFQYPMSRTKAAKEGNGTAFKGVPVEEYIPFTREECTKDLILAQALEEAQ